VKVLKPHFTTRRKRGKTYACWEIQTKVDFPERHILLDSVEWGRILEMADKYIALHDLVKKYYYDMKYSYEFLREWLTEEMRHLEKLRREYREKGYHKEAELIEFRLRVYTEELKHREAELRRLESILKELNIL